MRNYSRRCYGSKCDFCGSDKTIGIITTRLVKDGTITDTRPTCYDCMLAEMGGEGEGE